VRLTEGPRLEAKTRRRQKAAPAKATQDPAGPAQD
jgi:hypothetical protein